ncbi:O-antigen ligase family protein [Muriicola jejuensis]|uniref:O-antigen ligase-related domain-containing protein n=1 Tax=Muriicola jejuensis TaxID=504488 RepID=A0A6P0U9P4_9FLAO|nr:O-antigen ligase family protein [Muriicola jejuensis]NER09904.1 hypothetical protein [Muriicola jejuensis]
MKYSTVLLFIPTLTTFIFAEEIFHNLNITGKRITYLAIPFFFLFLRTNEVLLLRKKALLGLIYGAIFSSLLLISINFFEYYQQKPLWTIDKDLFNYYYTNKNYTEIIDIHPTYYGMYLLLALVGLLHDPGSWYKIFRGASIGIITLSIFFVGSRIILALFVLTILFYILRNLKKYFKQDRRAFVAFALMFTIFSVGFFSFFKNTYLYQRLTTESIWELSYEVGTNYNSSGKGDSRLARWAIAVEQISKSPLIGYGAGNESTILAAEYRKSGMTSAAKYEYNAHNQYLGFALEAGLLALILLFHVLGTNIYFGVRNHDHIGILFFVFIAFVCLFENYLIRNAAIIFVSFFGTVFLFSNRITTYQKRSS